MFQLRHAGVCEIEGMGPRILKASSSWRSVFSCTLRPFYPLRKEWTLHWIGGWVCPRAGLEVSEERKIPFPLSIIKPRFLGRPGLRVATLPAPLRSVTDLLKGSACFHCYTVASLTSYQGTVCVCVCVWDKELNRITHFTFLLQHTASETPCHSHCTNAFQHAQYSGNRM
jgi:hypothetical protein